MELVMYPYSSTRGQNAILQAHFHPNQTCAQQHQQYNTSKQSFLLYRNGICTCWTFVVNLPFNMSKPIKFRHFCFDPWALKYLLYYPKINSFRTCKCYMLFNYAVLYSKCWWVFILFKKNETHIEAIARRTKWNNLEDKLF